MRRTLAVPFRSNAGAGRPAQALFDCSGEGSVALSLFRCISGSGSRRRSTGIRARPSNFQRVPSSRIFFSRCSQRRRSVTGPSSIWGSVRASLRRRCSTLYRMRSWSGSISPLRCSTSRVRDSAASGRVSPFSGMTFPHWIRSSCPICATGSRSRFRPCTTCLTRTRRPRSRGRPRLSIRGAWSSLSIA